MPGNGFDFEIDMYAILNWNIFRCKWTCLHKCVIIGCLFFFIIWLKTYILLNMSCNIVFFTNNFYGYRHYAYISPVWLSLLFQGGWSVLFAEFPFVHQFICHLMGVGGRVMLVWNSQVSYLLLCQMCLC